MLVSIQHRFVFHDIIIVTIFIVIIYNFCFNLQEKEDLAVDQDQVKYELYILSSFKILLEKSAMIYTMITIVKYSN